MYDRLKRDDVDDSFDVKYVFCGPIKLHCFIVKKISNEECVSIVALPFLLHSATSSYGGAALLFYARCVRTRNAHSHSSK
ncbi:hypothetical protein E2C01_094409 [Portunus trituberculatus]|uniref:Uncharacterized protein n=1 Tax=Portunus trituberculatus TaxID=210409 RepID=A0A5B7JWS6_PORTR|nr:hypothetical protein [Portunus trituberculatus]